MSEHYGICARCDKDLVIKTSNDYYFSDIDCKVLCKECYEKEQPKELAKQIANLQSQLAITEKALELACERVKYFGEMQDKEMGFYDFFGYESNYDFVAIIKQYKQQAKEVLENENIC